MQKLFFITNTIFYIICAIFCYVTERAEKLVNYKVSCVGYKLGSDFCINDKLMDLGAMYMCCGIMGPILIGIIIYAIWNNTDVSKEYFSFYELRKKKLKFKIKIKNLVNSNFNGALQIENFLLAYDSDLSDKQKNLIKNRHNKLLIESK